jgi:phasin family protein
VIATIEPTAATMVEILEAVSSPAVESDPIPAAPIPAAALEEDKMATVESTADKAQATFGEMSARFKSAFEKSSKYGEEFVDFAKGNVEAVVASARAAAKASETLGADAAEYSKKSYESTMALFRSLAAVKSPTELLQLHSDYAKASFDAAVAEASKTSEKVLKLAGDVAQPLSSRYAVAAEKIKVATL